jgi:hypothetical protein
MPKNTVSDPITDQEMAFAHLILSGTMNDRRAAVRERLVDQEAEGLRQLNLGRDQILVRLWELANLSPEATRGAAEVVNKPNFIEFYKYPAHLIRDS